MIKNVYRPSRKVPVFFHISMKMGFSRPIFEKSEISNFMKIRPVGAKLLHSDRRTERQTLRS
jgi:hypothetical protein